MSRLWEHQALVCMDPTFPRDPLVIPSPAHLTNKVGTVAGGLGAPLQEAGL